MGIPIDDYKLYTLHFADDQVILAEDTTDAHYMLRKLDEEYTRWGLTINPSKTEYLVVRNVGESLELRDTEIKSTSSYKYLSVKITGDECNTQEIG